MIVRALAHKYTIVNHTGEEHDIETATDYASRPRFLDRSRHMGAIVCLKNRGWTGTRES